MKNPLISFVLLSVFTVPGSWAQEDAPGPPPCHLISDSILAAFEGAWTVEWLYRTAPGEFAESTAESRFEQDAAGCVLAEHFEGTLHGRVYAALKHFAEKDEGIYDQTRVDSEHGTFTQAEGRLVGDTLVFRNSRDLGERILRTRHIFFEFTTASFQMKAYMSRDTNAPWELVERALYRRREVGQ